MKSWRQLGMSEQASEGGIASSGQEVTYGPEELDRSGNPDRSSFGVSRPLPLCLDGLSDMRYKCGIGNPDHDLILDPTAAIPFHFLGYRPGLVRGLIADLQHTPMEGDRTARPSLRLHDP